MTVEGYLVEACASPDFTGTVLSSATWNIQLSTLTVSGLGPYSVYYLRVGSYNWTGRPHGVVLSTARTKRKRPRVLFFLPW